MGFSFRKRINLGSAGRINISKSGIGGSVGGKAGRIGISSQGNTYARGGIMGIYYRQNLENISDKTVSANLPLAGKNLVNQSAPRPSSNLRDLSNEELWTVYDQCVREYLPVFERFVNLGNQKYVIEVYNKEYLRVWGSKLGYDRMVQGEEAWKSFSKVLSTYQTILKGCEFTAQTVQNFLTIRKLASSTETVYRHELEGMVEYFPQRTQEIEGWCEQFERGWNRLRVLGWLPALQIR